MLVKGIIKDHVYYNLIEYVTNKCDTLRFLTRNDKFKNNYKAQEKLKELEVELYKNFSDKYICRKTDNYWSKYNDSNDLYYYYHFYKLDGVLKEYLLSNKDLYNWLNPNYPEDISFFKNGYCWLYSVAHEEICDIYCENEEEYKYLKSIGINFVDKEFIPTPKVKLYYEDYINYKE